MSDDAIPLDAEERLSEAEDLPPPPPEPDLLEGLIGHMAADPAYIFQPDVFRAVVEAKKNNPIKFMSIIRDLKQFRSDHPKSGVTFDLFNSQLKKVLQTESALVPVGEPDIATLLVELSLRAKQHFLDIGTEDIYADIETEADGNIYSTTVSVQSRTYERWLGMLFYHEFGRAAPREPFKAAIRTIEARTYSEQKRFHLFPRIAQVEDANGDPVIYLDRGDPTGEAYRITASGYELIKDPPIKFVRPEGGIGELPIAEPGGNIDDLEKMLNLRDRRDFVLAVGWVLGCFQPRYALLVALLLGRHGSAKTSAMRRLCALIDPIFDEPDEPPREDRELIVVAQQSYVQPTDNVVELSASRQAAICRMSTGGSQRGRRYYTNADTYRLRARRPAIMTAMRMVITAPDLIDRSVIIGMGSPFEEDNEKEREEERVLEKAFAAAWPKLFGCILDAVVAGLGHLLTEGPIPRPLPRMADYAAWTYRCEAGLGWERGTILRAYQESIQEYARDIAELDAVASGLLRLMLDRPDGWRGTVAMLAAELGRLDGGRSTRTRGWSWDLMDLSASVDELASVLFRNGLHVRRGHSGGRLEVILSWLPTNRPNGTDPDPPPQHNPKSQRNASATWRPES
jgi:hypothetical protein